MRKKGEENGEMEKKKKSDTKRYKKILLKMSDLENQT